MPSVRAASSALPRSREAIAVTSLHTPFCMPGMTFVTAIFAVLRIPQRTLDIARHHSRKDRSGKTCAVQKSYPSSLQQLFCTQGLNIPDGSLGERRDRFYWGTPG